ncbi:uncharacterized protein LOC118445816 [Vespa mandarinia]|uniref:uncharacterized protein LOC118445816 n=1 Tax=Vespa mandarinia TaxID=7446 RepID=UPI00160EAD29|nr:uncharacterized protein LOC118445816 [Vespa mandarinia]
MDKDINTNRKLNEWINFQKQLLEEKNFLTDILSKLDKQIHALQVEQLHLLSVINTKSNASDICKDTDQALSLQPTNSDQPTKQKPLDLSVPVLMDFKEEESEDDNYDELDDELDDVLDDEMDEQWM